MKCPICGGELNTWEEHTYDFEGEPLPLMHYECPSCALHVAIDFSWVDLTDREETEGAFYVLPRQELLRQHEENQRVLKMIRDGLMLDEKEFKVVAWRLYKYGKVRLVEKG